MVCLDLYGILEDEYFQHFLLLVESIWLMNQSSISIKDLKKSKALLHFCMQVEGLYGNRYETFNVHCLLHLTRCVKFLGPLWSCLCFWYEDYNGDIRKLYHGTQKVDLQIALSVCIQQKIPDLIPLLPPNSVHKDLYDHLSRSRWIHRCRQEQIDSHVYALGSLQKASITNFQFAYVVRVV